MKKRFQCIVAVHLFLIRNKKLLLLRRYNTGFCDGMFSVPAGHIDGGETVVKAMFREAREEITVELDKKGLKFVQVMHRKEPNKENKERIDFFFESRKWKGKIKIGEPNKSDKLEWVNFNNLPKNIIPYIKHAIEQYVKKKQLTFFGW